MAATAPQRTRRRWFGRRRDEQRTLEASDVPWLSKPTAAGVPITTETALRIVDVLACVRLLSESAATLPLEHFRHAGDFRTRLDDSGLTGLLRAPSPGTSMANLVASIVGSLALKGNAYVGKFRGPSGAIEQLAIISPDRVHVELVDGEPVYTLMTDSGVSQHSRRDVVHFKGLSLDGVKGLSPLDQARDALGLAAAMTEHAASLFRNGAAPRGVLAVKSSGSAYGAPDPTQPDAVQNLEQDWDDRHGGPSKAGRVAVIDADQVSFAAITLSPADTELLAQRKLSSTEVARLFRVPPSLIGAESGGSLTYTNAAQAADDLVRFSLAPLLAVVEQGITNDRDLCASGEEVRFDVDQFLRPDAETRSRIYSSAITAGWLGVDEVRAAERLKPSQRRTDAPQ